MLNEFDGTSEQACDSKSDILVLQYALRAFKRSCFT